MPRRPRGHTGGFVYHVLNRAVRRAPLLETSEDYRNFERVLFQSVHRAAMRMLAYCAMPNHWHMILWPEGATQLSTFMHLLTTTHAQRWHAARGSSGTGPVYQGRFKAIPIQSGDHLLIACRYVERNPLRAGLVARAEDWRWSSLWRRCNLRDEEALHEWPDGVPDDWVDQVNQPRSEAELEAIREAVRRGAPLGTSDWMAAAARDLNLQSSLRRPGRPAGPAE